MPEILLETSPLEARLERLIAVTGPISVAQYMAEANAHYYGTRDPLGAPGDFTTAPEISQMFGELIGLWLADLWTRSGRPADAHYVELGPGRGTLAVDALRALARTGINPTIELVESSPVLRQAQKSRLPKANWHDHPDSLPDTGPLLLVASEFFDALPVRQLVATPQGWRERMVEAAADGFTLLAGPARSDAAIPAELRNAPPGTIVEASPASVAIVRSLARRIAIQGGAALIVDYGHVRPGTGDTLQAVRAHRYADPWTAPGESDLTAHVDFAALAAAARSEGVALFGPVEQGAWLQAMGIDARAETLARAAPERAAEIEEARKRLVAPDDMGSLFKVLGIVATDWAEPVGFR